jgi:hypothetical protein
MLHQSPKEHRGIHFFHYKLPRESTPKILALSVVLGLDRTRLSANVNILQGRTISHTVMSPATTTDSWSLVLLHSPTRCDLWRSGAPGVLWFKVFHLRGMPRRLPPLNLRFWTEVRGPRLPPRLPGLKVTPTGAWPGDVRCSGQEVTQICKLWPRTMWRPPYANQGAQSRYWD